MIQDDQHRLSRGGTLAPVLFLIALLSVLAAIPRAALSQTGTGDADADTTAADSSGVGLAGAVGGGKDDIAEAPELLGTLSPKYATSYVVGRQSTQWDQDFSFGTTVGFLEFKNETTFRVKTDSGQDLDLRDGDNKTTMQWRFIKKLPLTTTFDLGRVSENRPNDRRQIDQARADANAIYNFFTGPVRHTVNGGGGYSFTKDISEKNSRSESRTGGVSGNLSWKGLWRMDKVTVNVSARESRSTTTLKLQQNQGPVDSRPSGNQNRALALVVNYDPASWLSSNVSLSDNSGNDERYLVQGGQGFLEKTVRSNQTVSATANLKPGGKTFFDLRASANTNDLSYRIKKENASAGNGYSWDGKFRTEVMGAKFETSLSSRKDVLEPVTSSNTDTRNNVVDGKIERPLSKKISAKLNWLLRVSKYYFDDPDSTRELDRDERRTKIQPSLTYKPGRKWTVTASYVLSTYRRVEQNPKQATRTRDDEDFSVDFSIGYALSDRTNINQQYSIKALYSTFDFSSDSDRLTQTQQIVTDLVSQLTPKVNLTFQHRFTLQDSGPFRFDESGARIFARSFRRFDQEMTTGIDYKLFPWLSLNFESRFFRTDNLNEATETRVTTRTIDLNQGFLISQSLGQTTTFSVGGNYRRSTVQESYWTINSSLNKDF